MKEKQVQISEKLFFELFDFFYKVTEDEYEIEEITEFSSEFLLDFKAKFEAMQKRETYINLVTATDEEVKEYYRNKYLDAAGINQQFRTVMKQSYGLDV